MLLAQPSSARVDSLEQALSSTSDNLSRVGILNQISTLIYPKEPAKSLKYSQEALSIAREENRIEERTHALINIGRSYWGLNRLDSAEVFFNRAIRVAGENNYTKGLISAYNDFGRLSYTKGDFAKAKELFLDNYKVLEKMGATMELANTANNLGAINRIEGNYEKAMEFYLKAQKFYEGFGNLNGIAKTNFNIGILYSVMEQLDLSLEYLNKNLPLADTLDDPRMLARLHKTIGDIQSQMNKFDEALASYDKALEIARKENDLRTQGRIYASIGQVEVHQEKFEEARANYQESIAIMEQVGDKSSLVYGLAAMGEAYINEGKYQQSLRYLNRAEGIAEEIGHPIRLKEIYEELAYSYSKLGRYKEAFEYQSRFGELKDSLFNEEKVRSINELQSRYDIQKSEAEIARLEAENTQQQLEMSRQNRIFYSLLGWAAVMVIFAMGMFFFLRTRQQKREVNFERERVQKLERVDRIKDQFLANTSHELRTPLNGIIGLVESLLAGAAGELSEEVKSNLAMISGSGRRLSTLVNDLLDFSQLKNQELSLQTSPVDLYSVTNVVLALSRPLTRGKKLELINEIPIDAPAVLADENRIQQIFHNLVGNAIKFTDEGSVRVTARQNGEMMEISVADTGIGIEPEKAEVIFKPFMQADGSISRVYGGTGLGLTVTRELVDLHGGKIWVESTPGKGTRFSFSLPLSEENAAIPAEENGQLRVAEQLALSQPEEPIVSEESQETLPPLPARNVAMQQEVHSAKILIVDDEIINLQVLQNNLQMEGYEIKLAHNGFEALKIIQQERDFDLVVLDIMMPKMSGYEVCRELRKYYLPSELPVIMLTAKNRVDDLMEGFDAGANDYLVKPFSRDELLSRIRTHLNLQNIHRATGKFVPYEFLRSIGRESITDVKLGDLVEKEVTVFFSDIRDYTSLAESMDPRENFHFVNSLNGRMGPIIQAHDGFVNQYLGDAIMALFTGSVDDALQAAIKMQHSLSAFNKERKENGKKEIRIGMGLHTGPLVMGIIGDENRLDAATIADTVNSASRIENLTKFFGANILLSEDVLKQLKNPSRFNTRYLGKVQVKGKSASLDIYECFDGDPQAQFDDKMASQEVFRKGLDFYMEKNFIKAILEFETVLKNNPRDSVARKLLTQAAQWIHEGVREDWTPVQQMMGK